MLTPRFIVLSSTLVLANCGWIDEAAAEDTKIVVYSVDADTQVVVDGGEAVKVSAGKFRSIKVGPGKHSISLNGDRKVDVTLEAFDRWVVPVQDEQCFMSLDVSLSHYGDNPKAAPSITNRKQHSAPFKWPTDNYLSQKELPKSRTSGQRALMLRSLPCDKMNELEAGLAAKKKPV